MDAIKSLKILVTGANGQLGRSILDVSKDFPQFEYHFKTSKDLDITDFDRVKELFHKENFDYCINCAAYTAVDKAESEKEKAFMINAEAVGNLAEVCLAYNVILLHISTDFVFDGTKTSPYTEEDEPNPINVYGASKLKGERYIQELLNKYFIIRTSWVYSEYGHNFVKTMLRLAREREEINVVNDQIGSPTYAGDLAEVLMTIITSGSDEYDLYHYSNDGEISWYDFAVRIFKEFKKNNLVFPMSTIDYPTAALRPDYSVLHKSKIEKILRIEIHDWRNGLRNARISAVFPR
tara:strand:- start:47866 stop:48744 length:879 start_codon:yes stop_codon:yes gene_type:complete